MTNHKKLYQKIRPYVNFKYDMRRTLTRGQKAAITRAANSLIPKLKYREAVTVRRNPGETKRAYAMRRNRIARSLGAKVIQGNKILVHRLPASAKYKFTKGTVEIIGSKGQLVAQVGGFKIHYTDGEKEIQAKVRALLEAHPGAKSASILTQHRGVSMSDINAAVLWFTTLIMANIQPYITDSESRWGDISIQFNF